MVTARAPPPPTPGELAPPPVARAPRDSSAPPAEKQARGPSPSKPQEGHKLYVIGISGLLNTILLISMLGPHIYRGPIAKSVSIYDTYSTLAALINSAAWLLYSIVVLKKEKCLDYVITNVVCYVANLTYLLAVCKHSKSTTKANMLIILTTLVFGTGFILLQLDMEKAPTIEHVFGAGSLVATLAYLFIQIGFQVSAGVRKVHIMGFLCIVLPNIAISIWTLTTTLLYHRDRTIILVSSISNSVLLMLDLAMVIVTHYQDIIGWLSMIPQMMKERFKPRHRVAESPPITRAEETNALPVPPIRRVNSAPALLRMDAEVDSQSALTMLRSDVEVNLPPAFLRTRTAAVVDLPRPESDAQPIIDLQRTYGNQGMGDAVLGLLQSIRGIQRTGPRDEEVGHAGNNIAQAAPIPRSFFLVRISNVWEMACAAGLTYFVVGAVLRVNDICLMICRIPIVHLVLRVALWTMICVCHIVGFIVKILSHFSQTR